MSEADAAVASPPPPTANKFEAGGEADLASLIARAGALYAHKSYNEAAEVYAEACKIQEDINGELAAENADLLYAYGRCLYHVAVAKSDVLGGTSGSTQQQSAETKKRKAEDVAGPSHKKAKVDAHVHIDGDDEEWSESDEEEEEESKDDEPEDDFALAWEILEMARYILAKKTGLEVGQDGEYAGTGGDKDVQEKLADTLDLQAEISLENEDFAAAVESAKASLAFKERLFGQDSSMIAEAHFKLALALEFASAEEGKEPLREEAASNMEKAIASTQSRLVSERARLSGLVGHDLQKKEEEIADVTSVLEEMKGRVSLVGVRTLLTKLNDLRTPPTADSDLDKLLVAVRGEMTGSLNRQDIERAVESANDLSGLTRKKKK